MTNFVEAFKIKGCINPPIICAARQISYPFTGALPGFELPITRIALEINIPPVAIKNVPLTPNLAKQYTLNKDPTMYVAKRIKKRQKLKKKKRSK